MKENTSTQEIWKWIPGYEDRYQVSTHGRVKSCTRTTPVLLKGVIHNAGYLRTTITNKDKVRKTYSFHKLVAMAFLGHSQSGHKEVVDHIDDNKLNNRLDNIQLISQRDNVLKSLPDRDLPYGIRLTKEGRYFVRTSYNGVRKYLGTFNSLVRAKEVLYDAQTHGVFSKIDKPKHYTYVSNRNCYQVILKIKGYPKFYKSFKTEEEAIEAVKQWRIDNGITI